MHHHCADNSIAAGSAGHRSLLPWRDRQHPQREVNWGDGQSQARRPCTGSPPSSHTYTAAGTYHGDVPRRPTRAASPRPCIHDDGPAGAAASDGPGDTVYLPRSIRSVTVIGKRVRDTIHRFSRLFTTLVTAAHLSRYFHRPRHMRMDCPRGPKPSSLLSTLPMDNSAPAWHRELHSVVS